MQNLFLHNVSYLYVLSDCNVSGMFIVHQLFIKDFSDSCISKNCVSGTYLCIGSTGCHPNTSIIPAKEEKGNLQKRHTVGLLCLYWIGMIPMWHTCLLFLTLFRWLQARANMADKWPNGPWWRNRCPDRKIHGANMGPTWVLAAPDGLRVGPMNFALRVHT